MLFAGRPPSNRQGFLLNDRKTSVAPCNRIDDNTFSGISLPTSTGCEFCTGEGRFNTITQNQIYRNGGLGINLAPAGVNPNDPGDGDTGPNDRLNYPVLTRATATEVRGTACAGCVVEVFVADNDPSGYGEGRTWLATATAASDGTFTAAIAGVSAGQMVTATATDPAGNTSEFAQNIAVR